MKSRNSFWDCAFIGYSAPASFAPKSWSAQMARTGAFLRNSRKKRLFLQRIVFALHDSHVGGVGVDIVPEEDKEIEGCFQRAIEQGMHVGVDARSERDAGKRLVVPQTRASAADGEQEKNERPA